MSENTKEDPQAVQAARFALPVPHFPRWLAHRHLRQDEHVECVYGPSLNPWWERYATHVFLIIAAGIIAATLLIVALIHAGKPADLQPVPAVGSAAIFFGSIFVVGFWCGYFTRLVVTNRRVFIVQGYAICRQWRIEDLPLSLIRYRRGDGPDMTKTVDLDALKTMLGDATGQVADSKTILALGKQLGNIRR
jgi:hypothetical protein